MEFIDIITSRSSVRQFDPSAEIPREHIDAIIKAAFSAPTAVFAKPWHFVVVTDRALLEELAAGLPYCKFAKNCSIAICVCGVKEKFLAEPNTGFWEHDLSAATQNILLAAHALGYGATWTATHPFEDRMGIVEKALKLPDNLVSFNVIPIGKPISELRPKDKHDVERVSFNAFE
eukprot:gnl/Chilomastix_cuspidata/229.p1 GENE.gnl/Chilomastix_cuspidata/229~~gnl/Chilomastix_cuspidata/229.p1  ORF type:complete len:175 (-),score=20.91 gnl/Chilomastix_cuspidata/229:156-680(-)